MAEVAFAVRVCRTHQDQDQVQKERTPANDENPQKDGQRDGAFHACGLPAVFIERHDAFGVHVCQDEHVQIEHGCENQRDAEEGHEAGDDRVVGVVDDEQRAGGDAGQPNDHDDGDSTLCGHDAVVAQGVEDGDVAIGCDGAEEGQRGHHGATDHDVNDVVQEAQHPRRHTQKAVVCQQHEHRLHHVAHTDQHVRHGEAADKIIHRRMQVPVLDDGYDNQNVLHQAYQAQHQEELLRDHDLSDAGHVHVTGCHIESDVVHVVHTQALLQGVHGEAVLCLFKL